MKAVVLVSYLKSKPCLPSEGVESLHYMDNVISGVTEPQGGRTRPQRPRARQPPCVVEGRDGSDQVRRQRRGSRFDPDLLPILEMRGAVNLRRTESVTKVVVAVWEGTLI